MKITAQEEYGLRCLLRLAKAAEGQSLTLPEVATAEGLSVPYAAKLLSVLRHAGLIESVRGRSGGYRLARPPASIGLGSLLLVLGEPLFDEPSYCERHAGNGTAGASCVHQQGGCSLRALWLTLDQITVADLLQSEGRIAELVRARLASAMALAPTPPLTLTPLTLAGREVPSEPSRLAPDTN
jgi:Rrf2 family protein